MRFVEPSQNSAVYIQGNGTWAIVSLSVHSLIAGLAISVLPGNMNCVKTIVKIAQAWPGGFAEYIAVPKECLERGTILPAPDGP